MIFVPPLGLVFFLILCWYDPPKDHEGWRDIAIGLPALTVIVAALWVFVFYVSRDAIRMVLGQPSWMFP